MVVHLAAAELRVDETIIWSLIENGRYINATARMHWSGLGSWCESITRRTANLAAYAGGDLTELIRFSLGDCTEPDIRLAAAVNKKPVLDGQMTDWLTYYYRHGNANLEAKANAHAIGKELGVLPAHCFVYFYDGKPLATAGLPGAFTNFPYC